jgi:hypothetical protein
VGTVVDVVVVSVGVELSVVLLGSGAPVEKRQPAPGGLNAVMLTMGGGKFLGGGEGGVVVDDGDVSLLVVGPVADVDVVVCCVVVGSAEGEC